MKQNFINDVVQNMLPFLNNAQMAQLVKVLEFVCNNVEIVENTQVNKQQEVSDYKLVQNFLASKRVEGCSEKSFNYYQATIL